MLRNFIILIALVLLPISNMFAYNNVAPLQNDTTEQTVLTETPFDFQSDYLAKSEIEHQKLIRNIFAIGFAAILIILGFVIVSYGKKIKKVSEIIGVQSNVLNSTKDQLIKIINVFNYIDRHVFITDAKGIIEWHNNYASSFYTEDYENNKISLVSKFTTENQGIIFQGINEVKIIDFIDNKFHSNANWKMIPIKNSKEEFSNMIFIGINK